MGTSPEIEPQQTSTLIRFDCFERVLIQRSTASIIVDCLNLQIETLSTPICHSMHQSIIASSLRTQSVVHNIAENQKRSVVKVVLEICSTSLKLSYALRQGNVLCRLCTYVCTCSCVCISLSVCVCVCMCMYVYVYVYVYVFVLETAARSKKNDTIVESHQHIYFPQRRTAQL